MSHELWFHFESLGGFSGPALEAKKTHNAAHTALLKKKAEYVAKMDILSGDEEIILQEDLVNLEKLVKNTGKNYNLSNYQAHSQAVSFYSF